MIPPLPCLSQNDGKEVITIRRFATHRQCATRIKGAHIRGALSDAN